MTRRAIVTRVHPASVEAWLAGRAPCLRPRRPRLSWLDWAMIAGAALALAAFATLIGMHWL